MLKIQVLRSHRGHIGDNREQIWTQKFIYQMP